MSNKNTVEEEKYYVPFCREKGCNGHLYTQLDENFRKHLYFCFINTAFINSISFNKINPKWLQKLLAFFLLALWKTVN